MPPGSGSQPHEDPQRPLSKAKLSLKRRKPRKRRIQEIRTSPSSHSDKEHSQLSPDIKQGQSKSQDVSPSTQHTDSTGPSTDKSFDGKQDAFQTVEKLKPEISDEKGCEESNTINQNSNNQSEMELEEMDLEENDESDDDDQGDSDYEAQAVENSEAEESSEASDGGISSESELDFPVRKTKKAKKNTTVTKVGRRRQEPATIKSTQPATLKSGQPHTLKSDQQPATIKSGQNIEKQFKSKFLNAEKKDEGLTKERMRLRETTNSPNRNGEKNVRRKSLSGSGNKRRRGGLGGVVLVGGAAPKYRVGLSKNMARRPLHSKKV
eukprot:m.33272 g.33272  ORF g.33272 m.33272 type:complete len:322 (+) comp8511_c0_seq1:83-1048(+)